MVGIARIGGTLRAAALACAAFLLARGADAAPLTLPDAPYNYTVIDQDLGAALQEFGANLGVKVNISPEVKGRIQGRIPEGRPQAFLDRLATNYNLEWYYDGSVLYVTSARESRTQLLVLNPIGFDALKGALDALQISDARFPVRPSPGKGVVMVSGPPRYVVLIEQTLAGLVAEEQARPKPAPPATAALSAPPPPRATVLTVFRGSSTTILRDGRPERVTGPEAEAPARAEPPAAANLPRTSLPNLVVPPPTAAPPQR
jgi:type III secretion protein C